jgi:hypothetical protein
MSTTENPTCQHYRIDNDTWQCGACGERMVQQDMEARTVLSAPNAAAGSGVYVPDVQRQKTVVIGHDVTYKCERCGQDGTVIDHTGISWDCGHVHRGADR